MAKPPPFGKQFAQARKQGLVPRRLGLGNLVVTLDWKDKSGAHPKVVIPPGEDPASYDLSFVRGLFVTVIFNDEQFDRVQPIVDALLDAGADRVDSVNRDGVSEWRTHRREAA